MLARVAVIAALAVVASALTVDMDHVRGFSAWKKQFGKAYETTEHELRAFENYKVRMNFVNQHNEEFLAGKHSFKVGVNQFMDMSLDDFRRTMLSPFNRTTPRDVQYLPAANDATVDWRTKGAVTPVKNQGQCGSCWSFSTTGSVEGAHAIATGTLVSLSEQELCDCSRSAGNMGCNGGLMDNAFKWIIQNGGLDTEEDYPYTARDGQCDTSKEAKKVVSISGYKDVPQNNEAQLAAAVANGPVSVAIEADQMAFQTYHSGVFDAACGTRLDHGVLTVGYTSDYWIVKNSWGESWGDAGYIMMKRGVGTSGICGIAMEPSYPTVSGDKAPEADYDYEKPSATGQCNSGEEAVRVTGLSGEFCSPSCSQSSPCPTNYPPGTTSAKGECVLEKPGSSSPTNCALICQPGSGSGGCPTGATCQPISGLGVCTWP